jgi:hypothetical protein
MSDCAIEYAYRQGGAAVRSLLKRGDGATAPAVLVNTNPSAVDASFFVNFSLSHFAVFRRAAVDEI